MTPQGYGETKLNTPQEGGRVADIISALYHNMGQSENERISENISKDIVEHAYKKLKSSVYYDKTQLILRNAIVQFEMDNPGKKLDSSLSEIYHALKDVDSFNEWLSKREIISKIRVISLPKKLADKIEKDNPKENNENVQKSFIRKGKSHKDGIITNYAPNEIIISQCQHFIDMPVEGHILGVLWIMMIGYRIADQLYEHSYGNRIRKKLINEFSKKTTFSPYLFEPYFEQYESWRDRAMEEAEKHMTMKQDVVIITMDFQRYYYSLDVNEKVMGAIYDDAKLEDYDECYKTWCTNLNTFVQDIIKKYASLFGNAFEGRRILPIGFLPSNIIGNWCLNRFDKAIVDGWNPVYYGRYVDDLLIVDKIEHNSGLQKKAKEDKLSKQDIIDYFLTSCNRWNGFSDLACKYFGEFAVLKKMKGTHVSDDGEAEYRINHLYNPVVYDNENDDKTVIKVQNSKVKVFYFKWDESRALITCFKNRISKNKSEFRHLPEDEAVFQRDDYSDIYSITLEDTPNKFRGVNGISLDRYELSKFLGKYLRIGGMVRDKAESRFVKDILKIFNTHTIIEQYSMWEKIIEILVINEQFDALVSFCSRIITAIKLIDVDNQEQLSDDTNDNVKKALYTFLQASICRCFALVWKEIRKRAQRTISDLIPKEYKIDDNKFDKMVEGYYNARMIDKSVIPIIIEMIESPCNSDEVEVNLTRFEEILTRTKNKWDGSDYKYYPYLVGMYDFNIASCIKAINICVIEEGCDNKTISSTPQKLFFDLNNYYDEEVKKYVQINYKPEKDEEYDSPVEARSLFGNGKEGEGYFIIRVGDERKEKLRIAIANVSVKQYYNFTKIVQGKPNRSYLRYKELSRLVNQAIDQKADMLVMPEAYVPFEWLSTLARTCAKNKLAIITGVEHFVHKSKTYNFTATILPYEEDTYRRALISINLKKHYAPSEIEIIEGYRLTPVEGCNHELYQWNDCYFPVYCCYELTSIVDRSVFQSYADMLVAVEWNRDVKYYSNILESLSRDIHCYCIQVNSSDYGDSRITRPSKSEEKDLIRTKGGVNSSILVDDIDIDALRYFQIKEYSLQKKDKTFKVTPPNIDKNIVMKKIKGESLW